MITCLKDISEECFLFNDFNVNASLKFLWAFRGLSEETSDHVGFIAAFLNFTYLI